MPWSDGLCQGAVVPLAPRRRMDRDGGMAHLSASVSLDASHYVCDQTTQLPSIDCEAEP
jgi:hypothetical protein